MAQKIPLSDNVIHYIIDNFGEEYYKHYSKYVLEDLNVYIRVSMLQNTPEEIVERLSKYGIELTPVENIPFAFKVTKGVEYIGKTIEYALGKYYIQSLSSMIPPIVLNPKPDEKILDLCAAPGSKSTEIADMMQNMGTFCVNEPNLDRAKGLVFNIDKFNVNNAGVTRYKGELLSKFFENYFDKILCDVPCSGLGILQKKGEVNNWWSIKSAERISDLQIKLLISAAKMLKLGGEIIYSTCTITLEENEYLINKFIKKYPFEIEKIELPVKSQPAFTNFDGFEMDESLKLAHRIIPWEINSEGFFIVKLRKVGEMPPAKKIPIVDKGKRILTHNSKELKQQFKNIAKYWGIPKEVFSEFQYLMNKNEVYFIDKAWEIENPNVFLRIGRKFGIIDKNGNIHLQTFALPILSKYINRNIIELIDPEDIRKYIDGGTIKKEFDEPVGQKVIKYNNMLIGLAMYNKEGLKSQFPRSLRTAEIKLPE